MTVISKCVTLVHELLTKIVSSEFSNFSKAKASEYPEDVKVYRQDA